MKMRISVITLLAVCGAMNVQAGPGSPQWTGVTEGLVSVPENWNTTSVPTGDMFFWGGSAGKVVVFDTMLNLSSGTAHIGCDSAADFYPNGTDASPNCVVWRTKDGSADYGITYTTGQLAIGDWGSPAAALRIESGTYILGGVQNADWNARSFGFGTAGQNATAYFELAGGYVRCDNNAWLAPQPNPDDVWKIDVVIGSGDSSTSARFEVDRTKATYMSVDNGDKVQTTLRVRAGGTFATSLFRMTANFSPVVILDGGAIVKNGESPVAGTRLFGNCYGGFSGQGYNIRMTSNGGTLQCDSPTLVDSSFVLTNASAAVLTKTGAEMLTLTGALDAGIGLSVQEGQMTIPASALPLPSLEIASGAKLIVDFTGYTGSEPQQIVVAGGTLTVPQSAGADDLVGFAGDSGRHAVEFDDQGRLAVLLNIEDAAWIGPATGTDAELAISRRANWNPNGVPSRIWKFMADAAGKTVVVDAAYAPSEIQVGAPASAPSAFFDGATTNCVTLRAADATCGAKGLVWGIKIANNDTPEQLTSGALRIDGGDYEIGADGIQMGKYGPAYFEFKSGSIKSGGDAFLTRAYPSLAVIGSGEDDGPTAVLDVEPQKVVYLSNHDSTPATGRLEIRTGGVLKASYIGVGSANGSTLVLDGGTIVKNGLNNWVASQARPLSLVGNHNDGFSGRSVTLELTSNGGTVQCDNEAMLDVTFSGTGGLAKTGEKKLMLVGPSIAGHAIDVEEGEVVIDAGVTLGGLKLADGAFLTVKCEDATLSNGRYPLLAEGAEPELPAGKTLQELVRIDNASSWDVSLVEEGGRLMVVSSVREENAVARIGSVYYTTLSGALSAAASGQTVTLMRDLPFSDEITSVPANVTLDLGGHVLTRQNLKAGFSFAEGGVVSNGTLAVSAALGANPAGNWTERLPVFNVPNGKSLVFVDVDFGDSNGHEPFLFSQIDTWTGAEIAISNGTWHVASLLSSSNSLGVVHIAGGRFFIRAWHVHDPDYNSAYQNGQFDITGGSFSLPPSSQWVRYGFVIQHVPTDTETPYHVVPFDETLYTEPGWRYYYADQATAEAAHVAKIGDNRFFTSLADAVNAAQSGETVTLVADVTALDAVVSVGGGKTITIDGDGHLVSARVPFVDESGYVASDFTLEFHQTFYIWNGCDVTMRNLQIRGGGIVEPESHNKGSYAIENNGTLILENVTITRSNGAIMNQGGAFVFIDNCRLVRNCRYCAGGLFNYGFAVMNRSSLSENRSLSGGGGGGASENGNTLYVNNCVICNNSSTEIGGAINNFNSGGSVSLYMMNTTVAGNFSAAHAYDNGGGIGLRAYLPSEFYAVNCLFCENYQNNLQNGAINRSDIMALNYGSESAPEKMTNGVYYSVYVNFGRMTDNHIEYFDHNKTLGWEDADSNVFNAYYATKRTYQNNIETTMPINGAQLVSKDDGSLNAELARYAPIKRTVDGAEVTYGSAVLGTQGVYTYFDASDWKNGVVKMSYAAVREGTDFGDLEKRSGDIVALGDLQPADENHMVTNYYESATGRSFGVAGASGWLEAAKVFHNVKLAGEPRNGIVTGISINESSYEEGTKITLTATPGYAREFLGWFEVDGSGNETLIVGSNKTVWELTVDKDYLLIPKFSDLKETLNPDPFVHVKMSDGEEAPLFPITVTTQWMTDHYSNFAEELSKKETVEAAQAWITDLLEQTDSATGLKMWQDYVLGIEPGDPNGKLWINSPQYMSTGKNLIRMAMNKLTPVSGTKFTINYRLDKKLGAATDFSRADVNTTGSYDVNVTTDPSGLYVIDLLFIPEGKATSEEYVTTVNTAGVLCVSNTAKRAAIAVPWTKLQPTGSSDVSALDLVKTTNLTPGDILYVYDDKSETKNYRAWKMADNGNWVPLNVFQLDEDGLVDWANTLAAAEGSTVARGLGVWLERANTNDYIYVCGQYEAAPVTSTALSEGWNLLGNPGTGPFDLAPVLQKLGKNDQIVVPTAAEPKTYTYENGAWGYWKTTTVEYGGKQYIKSTRVTNDTIVPAGVGFWYISEGKEAINW